MGSPFLFTDAQAARVGRARVRAVHGGTVSVVLEDDGVTLLCDVLRTTEQPVPLADGDEVLVWNPASDHAGGVVLGRIGPPTPRAESIARPPAVSGDADRATPGDLHRDPTAPDTLLIEATESITLKCGDGSITIRADGKILIKGKDLVSHAQRTNRIKGGAVAIN